LLEINTDDVNLMFCNPSVERAVLSAAINDVNAFLEVRSKLDSSSFLSQPHRIIYEVLISLYNQNLKKFDYGSIINELTLWKSLDQVGGPEYINAIISMSVDEDNLDVWISKLDDLSRKKELYIQLEKTQKLILDNKDPVEQNATSLDIIYSLEDKLLSLCQDRKDESPVNVREGLSEWYVEKLTSQRELTGLPTGFRILDKRLDGLVPGTLNVISAIKKMGKSALLLNVSAYVAYSLGYPVLVLDTEQPTEQFRSRLLSLMSKVPERKILHGNLNSKEQRLVELAIEIINKGQLYHFYIPGFTVEQVLTIFKLYKVKLDLKLGIFDYIKLPSTHDRNKKEYQILGDVTTALKDLAGMLNIPLLCAAQVNREDEVADSDKIERYADVIMQFTLKTDEENEKTGLGGGAHKLIIKRSRRGGETPKEGICMLFKKSILSIEEAPVQLINYEDSSFNDSYDEDILEND